MDLYVQVNPSWAKRGHGKKKYFPTTDASFVKAISRKGTGDGATQRHRNQHIPDNEAALLDFLYRPRQWPTQSTECLRSTFFFVFAILQIKGEIQAGEVYNH